MPTTLETPKIDVTTDYASFVLLGNNRAVTRGHVENLKREFEEKGNITAVAPIVVNERMEVIDGQHRLQAATELAIPVYYRLIHGATIENARHMNILHRRWLTDDYANSYAESGNVQYQKYLQLREDYGFSHSITLLYTAGYEKNRLFKEFRAGELIIEDEAAVRQRLETLFDIVELVPRSKGEHLAKAVLRIMESDNYNHARMLRKLAERGDQIVRRFSSTDEYLRALEDVFNYSYSTRTRLY